MANKGKMLDGRNIISEKTWNLMHGDPTLCLDVGLSKLEYVKMKISVLAGYYFQFGIKICKKKCNYNTF